jgi:hypothetical protein
MYLLQAGLGFIDIRRCRVTQKRKRRKPTLGEGELSYIKVSLYPGHALVCQWVSAVQPRIQQPASQPPQASQSLRSVSLHANSESVSQLAHLPQPPPLTDLRSHVSLPPCPWPRVSTDIPDLRKGHVPSLNAPSGNPNLLSSRLSRLPASSETEVR